MLPSVRPLLLTATLLGTYLLRTATADGHGQSVDPCSQFTCVLDCNHECGWDSHDDVCRIGQITSTSELYRKLGCTLTTVPTPGASDADVDACSQIICALDCNGECGWDGDDDVCRAGLTTADLDRALRSGDCGGADADEDSGDFGSSESDDSVPTTVPTASTMTATKPPAYPTAYPTANPTANPTSNPSSNPTAHPTVNPTANPTTNPTANPTAEPTANPTVATDVSSTVTVTTVSVAAPIDTTEATASSSEAAGLSDSLTIGPLTPQADWDGFTVEIGYSLQNRSTANMVLMMRRKGQPVWHASVGVTVEARTHTGITSVTVPIVAGGPDVETMILFVALLPNDALANHPEDRLAVGRAVVTVTDFLMAPPTTELPCTDTEGFLDRLGYSCSDWKNVPCTEFDGYDADAMADIRQDCQQTCDTCRTPTTEGLEQTCLAVSKACDGNEQCCSGQCHRSHNGAAVCRAGPGGAPVVDSSDDANPATESTSFGWTLLLVLAVASSLVMAWRSKSFPTTSKNSALLANLRYENDDDYLEMPSSLELDAFAAEDELVFSRRA